MTKLCKNCKWFHEIISNDGRNNKPECHHEMSAFEDDGDIDYVYGTNPDAEVTIIWTTCETMRDMHTSCGPKGKLFEEA